MSKIWVKLNAEGKLVPGLNKEQRNSFVPEVV